MVGALVACKRSEKPSTVQTPAPAGTSGSAAPGADARSTDSTLDPFDRQVRAYLDQTKASRDEAAKTAQAVSDRNSRPADAEAAVRARQAALAALIRTNVRATAQPGEIFSSASADTIRRRLAAEFAGSHRDVIRHELQEQNDETKGHAADLKVNGSFRAPRVPPEILGALPALPPPLEYAFHDRTLILRDVDADLVVDLLPNAFPEMPPQAPMREAESHSPHATLPVFPLPDLADSLTFAAIGDSGSGDDAQREIASLMFRYFTEARRFSFVLMLGDNLYDDDYTGEFALPYKDLLDAKVPFYAALGNHDRDNEQHYKPFNMNDVDRYQFDAGNARFVALNSNRPGDPAQAAWLDHAFADAGSKWRIAFFHHPLYSSGEHASQSRDSIRPALEPALVRNHVNVAFVGHEHLYERISPQHGIRYFVSGGGGRKLYHVKTSDFDETAFSEHHFMVVEISGDVLYYEAVSHTGHVLDCGYFWRPEAEQKAIDKPGAEWLDRCKAAITARVQADKKTD
jgi:calcineurin-like phosphoesterase family protein